MTQDTISNIGNLELIKITSSSKSNKTSKQFRKMLKIITTNDREIIKSAVVTAIAHTKRAIGSRFKEHKVAQRSLWVIGNIECWATYKRNRIHYKYWKPRINEDCIFIEGIRYIRNHIRGKTFEQFWKTIINKFKDSK